MLGFGGDADGWTESVRYEQVGGVSRETEEERRGSQTGGVGPEAEREAGEI